MALDHYIDLLHPFILKTVVELDIVKSKSEWRRLVEQDAITATGIRVGDTLTQITFRVGKHRFFRLKF